MAFITVCHPGVDLSGSTFSGEPFPAPKQPRRPLYHQKSQIKNLRSPIRADLERATGIDWVSELREVLRKRANSGQAFLNRTCRRVYGKWEPFPGLPQLDEYQDEPDLPFDKRDWAEMYQTCMEERDMLVTEDMITGKIPEDMEGTMFRNVPAGLHAGNFRFNHMFDGDGMVCKVTFGKHGKVRWTNRYVRTEAFIRERRFQNILYKKTFGSNEGVGLRAPLGRLQYKNVGNTNIIYWAGRLLALWEGGLPHRLDPVTLDTLGLETFEGKFRNGITFTTQNELLDNIMRFGDSFTAHPYIFGGRLVGFNYIPTSDGNTRVGIYEFSHDWQLVSQKEEILPGFALLHDFSVTPNYYVFLLNSLTLKRLPLLLGQKNPGECVRLAEVQNTRIVLIPRNATAASSKQDGIRILPTDANLVFHHVNAYEESDGSIVLNAVCQSSFSGLDLFRDFTFPNISFRSTRVSHLHTFRLHPEADKVDFSQSVRPNNVEFSIINPEYVGRPHRFVWMCESVPARTANGKEEYLGSPMQIYSKIDLKTGKLQGWYSGQRSFVNEPVFVPRKNGNGEDDGYLIGFVYDAGRASGPGNDIVILDAKNLNKGPVARIHLPVQLPPGLHASWVPQIFS